MRRFFSWIVLFFMGGVVLAVIRMLILLFIAILEKINDFSTAFFIFIVLTAGGLLLFILALPFIVGIPFLIKCSESVYPSPKGTRYKVFSIVGLICAVLAIIMAIINHTEWYDSVFNVVFYIVLLCSYENHLGETFSG